MKKRQLAHLACGLCAIVFMAGAAHAQDAETSDDSEASGVNVIVVTAQKETQNIPSIPFAITALAGEALENGQVNNVLDLGNSLSPTRRG